MAKMYYDQDANLDLLKGKTIAIIGYGSQGHAQAQNLRDSGIEVIVADLPDTDNYRAAIEDGFTPVSAEEAAKQAQVMQMLVPDEVQARGLPPGCRQTHDRREGPGLLPWFQYPFPPDRSPEGVDVIMVAPKGPGHLVRRVFREGGGVPNLIAVYQDATGKAKEMALAYSQRDRRHPRRGHRDHLQGRDRDRPLRRAVRALRRR